MFPAVFEDRSVVVTGASGGIGAAIATYSVDKGESAIPMTRRHGVVGISSTRARRSINSET